MRMTETLTLGGAIAANGCRRAVGAGEMVFAEGDRSDSVYVCTSGRLRVFVTTPSGQELLLGIKHPGDEFGELSALDGRPRSAGVTALEPSEVVELRRSRFIELLEEHPRLGVEVCQGLSAQLRRTNDRLVSRTADSATVRTGRLLVELASLVMRHGGGTDGRHDGLAVPITQHDLADWVGATRDCVARALGGFRREGLVETGRGRILVLDVAGLDRRLAAETC